MHTQKTNVEKIVAKKVVELDKHERYRERQIERGLKRIFIWVPEVDQERVRKYCEKLRKAHAKSAG